MTMMFKREVVSYGFSFRTARATAVAILMLSAAGAAVAAPPGAEKKAAAKPAPTQPVAHDVGLAAHWLSMLASTAAPNLESVIKPEKMGLLSDNLWKAAGNVAKFLTDNRDNEAVLKPFSENSAKLLSSNEAKIDVDNDQKANLLSGNRESEIEIEPFSDNKIDLLSHNHPKVLSGNRAKLFSDVNFLSGIKVSVTINIQCGDEHPGGHDRDEIESAFHRLDRDGDGKISAGEFRAVRSLSCDQDGNCH